jgi:hypothetical protein
MVILLVIGLLALAAGFAGTVAVCTALLALFAPKSRTGATVCFFVAVVTIGIGIVAICSSTAFFRYSAGGPVISFLVWATAGGVAVGIIAAAFAMSPIRRRLLADDSRAATSTI